jgi:hypothetical protein
VIALMSEAGGIEDVEAIEIFIGAWAETLTVEILSLDQAGSFTVSHRPLQALYC